MDWLQRYVISIDIGATKTSWGLVASSSHEVVRFHVEPTPREESQVLSTLLHGIAMVGGHQLVGSIDAIVLGIPGVVRGDGQILKCPNISVLEHVNFRELEQALAIPVHIVRDVIMATVGDWHASCPSGEDMVAMYIGSGIGVGYVIDGLVRSGWHGVGGEVGHWTVVPDGDRCSCGQRGCLETVASGESLRRAASRLGHDGADGVSCLMQGWLTGSAHEKAVVDTAIYYISLTLANLVKLLDPGRVVLGGGVIDRNPLLVRSISHRIQLFTEPLGLIPVSITSSTLGNQSPLIGGSWLVPSTAGRN
ncbi:MAG: hypothetical protein C7B45_15835 [Sulfobacillus acidophilus]|uniref:ROK family protein n=1 Tax=Sulfobacillus acidophilus TaxID=53633 RepID=A0A2T2WDB7_9FIRM|nr:MAG: hypothetical protein C7B45_15835 [Sulfobacillus acidophilus]